MLQSAPPHLRHFIVHLENTMWCTSTPKDRRSLHGCRRCLGKELLLPSMASTAVGDKYVYEYMAKNGCRIGGEQSGHIIFSKYASTGDGILTSLKMMEVMLAKKKPMSELAAPLKIYPQVLENVRVTDKKAAQNDPAVQEAVNKVAEALGDTGRILARGSGTEPVVRVMVETPDHDTCQKYVDEVVNVICEKGYKV